MRKLTTSNAVENDFNLWSSYTLLVKFASYLLNYSDKTAADTSYLRKLSYHKYPMQSYITPLSYAYDYPHLI